MNFETIYLDENRTIVFEKASDLFVFPEKLLCADRLPEFRMYFQYFPETVYLEEDQKVTGVLTAGDVNRSFLSGELKGNCSFFCIRELEKTGKEDLENFFAEHFQIRSLPLILRGTLIGQFTLKFSQTETYDRLCWDEVAQELRTFCRQSGHKKIVLDEETVLYKKIIEGDEAFFTPEEIKECGFCSIKEDSDADLAILSNGRLKKMLRKRILGESMEHAALLSEQDLYTECLIPHILNRFRLHKIDVAFLEPPIASKIKDLGGDLKQSLQEKKTLEEIAEDESLLLEIYGEAEGCKEFLRTKEFHACRFLDQGNYCNLADYQGKHLHITGGRRNTCFLPEKFRTRIWMYGTCLARGAYVDDRNTIESLLQEKLNQSFPDTFQVVNCGVAGRAGNDWNAFHYMLDTKFSEGDLVLCLAQYSNKTLEVLQKQKVEILELSPLFERSAVPGRWFLDQTLHVNQKANKAIAEYVFRYFGDLLEEKASRKQERKEFRLGETACKKEEPYPLREYLEEYLEEIRPEIRKKALRLHLAYPPEGDDWRLGCIVMNCNPFTLGHRYLIETAAQKSEFLIIFVVQEDRSVFPFQDRIELVRRGTEDLENVLVLPSGKFMISSETFPEYFHKSHLQKLQIDTSRDVRIFGNYIAPMLGIGIRFVGSEPIDQVTAGYNRSLAELLPQYGVRLIEIERKQEQGEVISASRVRALMKEKEYEKLDALVPPATKQYILEREKNDRTEKQV